MDQEIVSQYIDIKVYRNILVEEFAVKFVPDNVVSHGSYVNRGGITLPSSLTDDIEKYILPGYYSIRISGTRDQLQGFLRHLNKDHGALKVIGEHEYQPLSDFAHIKSPEEILRAYEEAEKLTPDREYENKDTEQWYE